MINEFFYMVFPFSHFYVVYILHCYVESDSIIHAFQIFFIVISSSSLINVFFTLISLQSAILTIYFSSPNLFLSNVILFIGFYYKNYLLLSVFPGYLPILIIRLVLNSNLNSLIVFSL